MRSEFTIGTMADLNAAIAHYCETAIHQISQPSRDNERGVKWNERIQKDIKDFWWNRGYKEFLDFEVHLVKQYWGSTSAGWGGIGGAAMTSTYTTIIHCPKLKIIAVYYGNQLAYVMDIFHEDIDILKHVPPYSSVKEREEVIYRHKFQWEWDREKKELEKQKKTK